MSLAYGKGSYEDCLEIVGIFALFALGGLVAGLINAATDGFGRCLDRRPGRAVHGRCARLPGLSPIWPRAQAGYFDTPANGDEAA